LNAVCIDEPHWRSTTCRRRSRPARDEQRHARDVERLLADLADAAHLDVLDLPGVEIEPADEAVQRLRGELLGADARKGAVPPPDGGTDRVDDERVGHGVTRYHRPGVE
jgi:hypothetical protein